MTPREKRRQLDRVDALGRLIAWSLACCFLMGPLLVSFVVTPEAIDSGSVVLSPPCAFKALAGVGCPTCGLTRAFTALGHGRISESFAYHWAALPVYAAFWIGAGLTAAAVVRAARDLWGARIRVAEVAHSGE